MSLKELVYDFQHQFFKNQAFGNLFEISLPALPQQ